MELKYLMTYQFSEVKVIMKSILLSDIENTSEQQTQNKYKKIVTNFGKKLKNKYYI